MAQVEQSTDLPEEVWKEILLKLWLNEEDLEHVLTCRKVCRMWEKLVDEMPAKLYWNPWLKHSMDEYRTTVQYSIATIINSDTDIRKFLSANFEPEKNPFRNHTLSIFLEDVNKEEKNLLKIIEDHGKHVWKFLYQCNMKVSERLASFPHLLVHMKHIRTLVLDCGYLSTKDLMALDGNAIPEDLNNLTELVLSREYARSLNDMKEEDRMYAKFSINYGSQIKSLTFDIWRLYLNRSKIMERFPNLEDLRIECRSIDSDVLVPHSGKQWPKLKRLTLSLPWSWWDPTPVKYVLRVAAHFAETLKLLSLRANLEKKKTVYEKNQVDVITTFPRLTQLIIPFWFMYHECQPTNLSLETAFRFSLPNLKLLVLEDIKDEFKDRDIGGAELEEFCAPLWPLVPSSVETISVRSEKTNQVLHQDFPVVYKCKRNEAA